MNINKEYGSFYHAVEINKKSDKWCKVADPVFMGSGRDALYAILSDIGNVFSSEIKRIWLPSYYCHSVTHVLEVYFDIFIYEARPGFSSVVSEELSRNDLLVALEFFGNKADLSFSGTPWVVLDKTHNPISEFSYSFNVDFVFGSLRKILPIADGGFYFCNNESSKVTESWSLTERHKKSFDFISKAMSLKADYLEFNEGLKNDFLNLHAQGESSIGKDIVPSGIASDIELVKYSDVSHYLLARKSNNLILACKIKSFNIPVSVLESNYFFTVLFDNNHDRDFFRAKLIENNIYPVVLWPVDDKYMLEDDKDLSMRMLVLPTDFRYGKSDMEYIANVIKEIFEVGRKCLV